MTYLAYTITGFLLGLIFDFIYDTYERRKKRDVKRVHKQAKQRRTYYKR